MIAVVKRPLGSKSETRLAVCVRRGDCLVETKLQATALNWDKARAEAQSLLPGHTIIIPRLGEKVPS